VPAGQSKFDSHENFVAKFSILKGELDEQHAWKITRLKEGYDKPLTQNEVKSQRALRDLLLKIQDPLEVLPSSTSLFVEIVHLAVLQKGDIVKSTEEQCH
jgi:hypothetical protein